jgi:ketosteroid isomerase-like protein
VLAFAQPSGAQAELATLEQQRLAALAKPDAAALRALLSDDYMHVHSTGRVEDRETFIKGISERPRRSEREALTYRVYGDAAVITGVQVNHTLNPDGSAAAPRPLYVTQVAVRRQGRWRLVSMQATNVGPNNAPSAGDVKYPAAGPERLSKAEEDVIALEARRAAAIAQKDFTALAGVLGDDYLHVYGDGRTSDRAGYIKEVEAAPRVPTRGPLKARVYGDVAVLTGDLLNRITYPDRPTRVLDTFVTQVLRRTNGQWRFVSFQITPKTPA